jgi:ferrous iron transport protein A
MSSAITLSSIPIGKRVEIMSIKEDFVNRDRLIELGFTENTEVIPLHKSPSGSPTAYYVRGAVMALRTEDADNICIRTKEDE